uniref:Vancomycin B-type resistance protein VanW n=1 Tax=uncultured organism TaxID=155900 RepID=W0NTS6_9ZZZZ|nr:vancomycin B-type resistance protein VanW [uncultured organism]
MLAVVFAFVYAGSADTIAKGVRIDGVDVGGLSSAEAVNALEKRGQVAQRKPVEFVAAGRTFRLTAADVGLTPDWAAAVSSARHEGGGFAPVRGFKRMKLRVFGGDVDVPASYRAGALKTELARIAAKVDRPHRDAALVLHGLRPAVVAAQMGTVLDRKAAADAIVAALSSISRGARVNLTMKADRPRVTAATLASARAQARVAVSAPVVLTLGPTRYRIPRWRVATLLKLPRNGATRLRIGGPAADTFFKAKQRVVDTPARDAQFVVITNGIRVQPSTDARVLDVPSTADKLLAAAVKPVNRTAPIVVATKPADRTTKDALAMGITGLYSSYTTTYGGVPNRIHNVQVVAHLVDNTLIAPGKEFSFNGTTGERNAAKGLLEAPVIINGELQNGLGGGTCQVSTTVFNAAYEGGLPITARTNHALYISHYPQGRDATVNYPDIDLRFVNDTGHWLLLRTFVSSNSLTVNLYGTPEHRRVVSETSPLVTTGAVPEQIAKDPNVLVGQRVVDQQGSPPLSTSVNRKVYDEKGKLLYDNTWYSSYVGDKSIIRVGTKKKPKPKPKEKPVTLNDSPSNYPLTDAGAGSTVPATTEPATTTPTTTTPAESTPYRP